MADLPAELPRTKSWLSLDQPAALPNGIAVLVAALRDEGVAPESVLDGTGLVPAQIVDPDTRLTTRQVARICQNALRSSRRPLLAAEAGSRMSVSACGPYGFALMSSQTHADVLASIQRHHRLLGPFIDMQFDAADGPGTRCVLSLHPAIDRKSPLANFLLEFKVAAMRRVMHDLYGNGVEFRAVHFRGARPACAAALGRALGCPLRYGSPRDEVLMPLHLLALRPAWTDPLAHASMQRLCDDLHVAPRVPSSAASVPEALQALLSRPDPAIRDVSAAAAALGWSVRSLQRALGAQGTSFRAIQDGVRKQRAIRLLSDARLTVDAVAVQLGYAEPSNFRHAFRRWTGQSATAFRGGARRRDALQIHEEAGTPARGESDA